MFANVVELYRAAGRPAIVAGAFSFDGPLSDRLGQAIDACKLLPDQLGYFDDGPDFAGASVSFEWKLSDNEQGRFFTDVSALVLGSPVIGLGRPLPPYYLIGDDFLAGSASPPAAVEKLDVLSELVELLAALALADVDAPGSAGRILFFVLPAGAGSPPKTVELRTRVTPQCLELPVPDLRVVRAIAKDEGASVHSAEHKQLFRLAVAEALNQAPRSASTFEYLIERWADVTGSYSVNADFYVHNFSLDKVRREITSAAVDFSARLTAAMGDSTAKLLALPISAIAAVGISKSDDLLNGLALLVGVLLVGWLLLGALKNQRLQLARVKSAFDVTFQSISEGRSAEAGALISTAKSEFDDQYNFLYGLLRLFRFLAWAPVLVAVFLVFFRFNEGFNAWVLSRQCVDWLLQKPVD